MKNPNLTHIEKLVKEIWNTGDLHRSNEFFSQHFLFNGTAANANDALQYQARLRQNFDSLTFTIEDLFDSEDQKKISLLWFASATHKTDKRPVEWFGLHIFYFNDAGQISAVWSKNIPPV